MCMESRDTSPYLGFWPRIRTGGWVPMGASPTLTLATPPWIRTVLDLLAVTRGLLKLLDDERSSGGNDVDLGVTVLDGQLAGDLQALPITGSLGDVISNLLGRLKRQRNFETKYEVLLTSEKLNRKYSPDREVRPSGQEQKWLRPHLRRNEGTLK